MSVLPGSSYHVSNAWVIAKRHLLQLEDPVRIRPSHEWPHGQNPLHRWFIRHPAPIDKLQLRKEHKSPFFHEYLMFSLRDNGGFFRIDRRQRPDENIPLDSIYANGVEAYDTIEQATSFDDEIYSSSSCLVEIEFKVDLDINLHSLMKICWAIQEHPQARLYTVQRYNCYFFAQTILICATHLAYSCQWPKWGNTCQHGQKITGWLPNVMIPNSMLVYPAVRARTDAMGV